MRRVAALGGSGGRLDYVAAWLLWPLLLNHRRLEISFAHRTFAWGSDARGKAHMHVVIIGLDTADHVPRDRRPPTRTSTRNRSKVLTP